MAVATTWQDAFKGVDAEIASLTSEDMNSDAVVLTGLLACVDAIARLDDQGASALAAGIDHPDADVSELGQRIVDRLTSGRGGELETSTRAQDWLGRQLPFSLTYGGTSLHAAVAFSMMGIASVTALSDRSATQVGVVPDGVRVVGPDLLPTGAQSIVATQQHPRSIAYIIEVAQGTKVGPSVVVPRSTRIIVVNRRRQLDLDLLALEYAAVNPVPAVLVSGFQACGLQDWDRTLNYVRLLRATGAGDVVSHHEMAEYAQAEFAEKVLAELSPYIPSVGMSMSELGQLTTNGSPADRALDLARRYRLERLLVHADDGAFCVTTTTALETEKQALMAGCLVAATRAADGVTHLPDGIPSAAKLDATSIDAFGDIDAPDYRLVAVPSPYVQDPKVTVGLGDTFAAGFLSVLVARSHPFMNTSMILKERK